MSGLEELRRLEAAATEGPWAWEEKASGRWLLKGSEQGVMRCASMLWPSQADAEFIVAARNQLPRILDALDAVLELAESAPRFTTHDGGNASGILQADAVIAAITKALEGKQ